MRALCVQTHRAAALQTSAQKDNAKRKRIQKQVPEIPDGWADKGMRVIDKLLGEKFSPLFAEPVVPRPDFAPDYLKVVKNPMDIGSVRDRLRSGHYSSVQEFESVRCALSLVLLLLGCCAWLGLLSLQAQRAVCASPL